MRNRLFVSSLNREFSIPFERNDYYHNIMMMEEEKKQRKLNNNDNV